MKNENPFTRSCPRVSLPISHPFLGRQFVGTKFDASRDENAGVRTETSFPDELLWGTDRQGISYEKYVTTWKCASKAYEREEGALPEDINPEIRAIFASRRELCDANAVFFQALVDACEHATNLDGKKAWTAESRAVVFASLQASLQASAGYEQTMSAFQNESKKPALDEVSVESEVLYANLVPKPIRGLQSLGDYKLHDENACAHWTAEMQNHGDLFEQMTKPGNFSHLIAFNSSALAQTIKRRGIPQEPYS